MSHPLDPGPTCRCGCTWVEHEKHVDDQWRTYAGRCLSCPCEGYEMAGWFVGDLVEKLGLEVRDGRIRGKG